MIADRFLRRQIMLSPLLQLFDNVLIRLRERLERALERGRDTVCPEPVRHQARQGRALLHHRAVSGRTSGHRLFVPCGWRGGRPRVW